MKPGDQVKFKESAKWDPMKHVGEVDPDGIYTILEIHPHIKGPYVDLEGRYPNYPLHMFELASIKELNMYEAFDLMHRQDGTSGGRREWE